MLSVFCAVPVSLLLKYIKLYLLLVFIINLTDTSLISSNLTKLLRYRRRKVGVKRTRGQSGVHYTIRLYWWMKMCKSKQASVCCFKMLYINWSYSSTNHWFLPVLLALERMFNVKCMLLCSNDMKLVVTLSEGHKMLTGQSPDNRSHLAVSWLFLAEIRL